MFLLNSKHVLYKCTYKVTKCMLSKTHTLYYDWLLMTVGIMFSNTRTLDTTIVLSIIVI